MKLTKGTQIIYVPNHADDINHPDCEDGFVTSVGRAGAFCRYWSNINPGHLRTMANSELTPFKNLVIRDTCLQSKVDKCLRIIEDEER